jgi:hypothetical protein
MPIKHADWSPPGLLLNTAELAIDLQTPAALGLHDASPTPAVLGGGPMSASLPPLASSYIITSSAKTVPTSSLLSSILVEVPFSQDVGCYTPLTSPDRAASPSLSPPIVSGAPPLRHSTRHVVAEDGSVTTDEDTMQNAMRRKATINLDYSGMTSHSSSFILSSTPILSSKLNAVGIKLGKNVNEVNVSANVLRHIEYDRLTVVPKLWNVVDPDVYALLFL